MAGAAEAGLDFIGNEQDVVAAADFGGVLDEARGRNQDARFALDGLKQEGAGVGRDGGFERRSVAEGDDTSSSNAPPACGFMTLRSEEHTSELQSH